MLLWVATYLSNFYHAFQVFHYLTLRGVLSTLTSLLICLLLGPTMIRRLTIYKVGQQIRGDGPQSHLSKAGTPTMGGALIIVAVTFSALLWANLTNRYV